MARDLSSTVAYGPATTLGRSVASGTGAFLGLVCLIVPSLQGVPWPTVVYFMVIELGLLALFLIHARRWGSVTRRAEIDARSAGAFGAFAFMQVEFAPVVSEVHGYRPSGFGIGGALERRDIPVAELS